MNVPNVFDNKATTLLLLLGSLIISMNCKWQNMNFYSSNLAAIKQTSLFTCIKITKCLHNRPDGYILNDRHYVCERHHACAEVSSKPNKNDDDQTCEKLGCFDTRKPCLNCSFEDDDTKGFQNILAMCLLRPEQRNKLKNPKTCLFHQR